MKSIIQTNEACFICHQAIGTETHHIFGGPNRKWSDKDGLTIRVCRYCHEKIHAGKDSGKLQKSLHELGQAFYEMKLGTRADFMERYGRNYL